MFYALVYYPQIDHQGFQAFRQKYEPYSDLLPEHLPFVFPVPESIGYENLVDHIGKVLEKWTSFDIHISGHTKTWDHWLMLVLQEGNEKTIQLHDDLYTGLLAPYIREDLPYLPHIGLGLFSKEDYDFNNPTAELQLDKTKYEKALTELRELNLDFWRRVDSLTLVKVNQEFTKCWDVREFKMNSY